MGASQRASHGFHRLAALLAVLVVLASATAHAAESKPTNHDRCFADGADIAVCGVDDYTWGFFAYKRGDYATALRFWRPLAEQGHAQAQAYLGNMYVEGEGIPKDIAEAAKWSRLAAEQGVAYAQRSLSLIYSEGGDGVPQDYAEVVKWARLAAEQGDATAQGILGACYRDGSGVLQDYVLAHMWLNLAASRYSAFQAETREERERVASKMTPEQIAEAQRLAREWKPK